MFMDIIRAREIDAFDLNRNWPNDTPADLSQTSSPVPAHCLRMPQITRLLADAEDLPNACWRLAPADRMLTPQLLRISCSLEW